MKEHLSICNLTHSLSTPFSLPLSPSLPLYILSLSYIYHLSSTTLSLHSLLDSNPHHLLGLARPPGLESIIFKAESAFGSPLDHFFMFRDPSEFM
jgi:hypothetical protein